MASTTTSAPRRRWVKPLGLAAGVVAATALVAPPAFAWDLHRTVENNVKHAQLMPAAHSATHVESGARNYLLIGTNNAGSAAGSFTLAHVSADGERVDLIAVPRDFFDADYAKVGPAATTADMERKLDIRVDQTALIDFAGVTSVVDAIGGVRIDGKTLNGAQVLEYIHGSNNDNQVREDQRQLKFLKTMATQVADSKNPMTVKTFVDALSKALTIDTNSSASDLESMATDLAGSKVHTARLNPGKAKQLREAIAKDDLSSIAQ